MTTKIPIPPPPTPQPKPAPPGEDNDYGKPKPKRCEGLVGDERCQEPGTHFLINRDHGPENDDKVLLALERDCPDDPMRQIQLAGWFCAEHAGHILGHYPMMTEIAV